MSATPARLAALEIAAAAAFDHPERRCQHALAEIYFAAGWLPRFAVPDGPRGWAQSQSRSLMAEFLAGCPHFALVAAVPLEGDGRPLVARIEAGDLLLFQLGHAAHHLALALGGGRMVHTFHHHGLTLVPAIPTPWARQLRSVWRPQPA